jgi:hypothetical protein
VGYQECFDRKEVYGQGIPDIGTQWAGIFDSKFDSHRVGIRRLFRTPAY